MWQGVSWILVVSRNHRLVKHQVHRKRQVIGLEINSVIRRPDLTRFALALKVVVDNSVRSQRHNRQQQQTEDRTQYHEFGANPMCRRNKIEVSEPDGG